jgi:hypothetical protein
MEWAQFISTKERYAVDQIYMEGIPAEEIGVAILNRL